MDVQTPLESLKDTIMEKAKNAEVKGSTASDILAGEQQKDWSEEEERRTRRK